MPYAKDPSNQVSTRKPSTSSGTPDRTVKMPSFLTPGSGYEQQQTALKPQEDPSWADKQQFLVDASRSSTTELLKMAANPKLPSWKKEIVDDLLRHKQGSSPTAKTGAASGGADATHPDVQRIKGSYELKDLGLAIDAIGRTAKAPEKGDNGLVFGSFVAVDIGVDVPIPEVPGLSLTLGMNGEYCRLQGGQQELELSQTIGIQWSFLDIINVNRQEMRSLKLQGASLGAALIDAIKQTVRQILIATYVEGNLADLVAFSKRPWYQQAAEIGLSMLSGPLSPYFVLPKIGQLMAADQIQACYARYCEFFENNPEVGFEVSVGSGGGLELGNKDAKASGKYETKMGVEDVDDRDAQMFAEVAAVGALTVGNSEVAIRVAMRFLGNGTDAFTFELTGSFPGLPGAGQQIATGVQAFLRGGAFLGAFEKTSSAGKMGAGHSVDIPSLIMSAVNFIPIPGATQKFGLDLGLEKRSSDPNWSASARIKEMKSLSGEMENKGAGAEGSLEYGTFVDISAAIQACLNSLKLSTKTPPPAKLSPLTKGAGAAR